MQVNTGGRVWLTKTEHLLDRRAFSSAPGGATLMNSDHAIARVGQSASHFARPLGFHVHTTRWPLIADRLFRHCRRILTLSWLCLLFQLLGGRTAGRWQTGVRGRSPELVAKRVGRPSSGGSANRGSTALLAGFILRRTAPAGFQYCPAIPALYKAHRRAGAAPVIQVGNDGLQVSEWLPPTTQWTICASPEAG